MTIKRIEIFGFGPEENGAIQETTLHHLASFIGETAPECGWYERPATATKPTVRIIQIQVDPGTNLGECIEPIARHTDSKVTVYRNGRAIIMCDRPENVSDEARPQPQRLVRPITAPLSSVRVFLPKDGSLGSLLN